MLSNQGIAPIAVSPPVATTNPVRGKPHVWMPPVATTNPIRGKPYVWMPPVATTNPVRGKPHLERRDAPWSIRLSIKTLRGCTMVQPYSHGVSLNPLAGGPTTTANRSLPRPEALPPPQTVAFQGRRPYTTVNRGLPSPRTYRPVQPTPEGLHRPTPQKSGAKS